jgi:hypothetical protein
MPGFEFVEKRSRRLHPAFFHVLETLADALRGIRLSSNVQKPLVRSGILYNRRSLALDGQDYRTRTFLELSRKFCGAGSKEG